MRRLRDQTDALGVLEGTRETLALVVDDRVVRLVRVREVGEHALEADRALCLDAREILQEVGPLLAGHHRCG